ncbi:hypothetical protein D3C71_2171130 [compost metagenome]
MCRDVAAVQDVLVQLGHPKSADLEVIEVLELHSPISQIALEFELPLTAAQHQTTT